MKNKVHAPRLTTPMLKRLNLDFDWQAWYFLTLCTRRRSAKNFQKQTLGTLPQRGMPENTSFVIRGLSWRRVSHAEAHHKAALATPSGVPGCCQVCRCSPNGPPRRLCSFTTRLQLRVVSEL